MHCSWGGFAGLVTEPLPVEGWGLSERNRKCRSHRSSHPGSRVGPGRSQEWQKLHLFIPCLISVLPLKNLLGTT